MQIFFAFFQGKCPDVFLGESCGCRVLFGVLTDEASAPVELFFAAVLCSFRESAAGIIKPGEWIWLDDMLEQQVKTYLSSICRGKTKKYDSKE